MPDNEKKEGFKLPGETMRKNAERKKRRGALLKFALFLCFLPVPCAVFYVVKFAPETRVVPFRDYYELYADSEIAVCLDGEFITNTPARRSVEGEIYLPLDLIRNYIDGAVFYEPGNAGRDLVTVIARNAVNRVFLNEAAYFSNGAEKPLEKSALLTINGKPHLSAALTEYFYGARFTGVNAANGVLTGDFAGPESTAEVLPKKAYAHYEPNVKSVCAAVLLKGDAVNAYPGGENGFVKIRTENGLIGFVRERDVKITEIASESPEGPAPAPGEKIIMAWEQIYSQGAGGGIHGLEGAPIDIISPTWFGLNGLAEITSIASADYVNEAHGRGVKVWPLVSDGFNASYLDTLLTAFENRDAAVSRLLELAKTLGFDGVNIDFETVTPQNAACYAQFLRELSVHMKSAGLTLSVDMYVPTFTKHYNRKAVSEIADYVCLMAYDEHYGEQSGAGPCASLPFVKDGVTASLLEIPPEKLILGVPLFSRAWRIQNGKAAVYKNFAMGYAETFFKSNGAEINWLESLGCNYSRFDKTENNVNMSFEVWLEDEKSIEKKLELVSLYNLAGMAGWSLNLETDGFWEKAALLVK